MFFHAQLEGPVSSSTGTSSARGLNSTWPMTVNPPGLTQTPPHPTPPHPPPGLLPPHIVQGLPPLLKHLLGLFQLLQASKVDGSFTLPKFQQSHNGRNLSVGLLWMDG